MDEKKQTVTQNDLDNLLKSFWLTVPTIWHATRSITHHTAIKEFGLTGAQFHVLGRIAEGKASVSMLADCMHLSRPNISRTVDELVNAGLVKRERDFSDRRNIALTLTQNGKKLIEDMHAEFGRKMKKRFLHLNKNEIEIVLAALNSLQKIFAKRENGNN